MILFRIFAIRLAECLLASIRKILAEADLCDMQPDLNYSAIVGCVKLVDCENEHPSEWAEKGMWHWVCENQIWFKKPIVNVKGQLGIWDWEGEIPELEGCV